jgi:hypothetical protein
VDSRRRTGRDLRQLLHRRESQTEICGSGPAHETSEIKSMHALSPGEVARSVADPCLPLSYASSVRFDSRASLLVCVERSQRLRDPPAHPRCHPGHLRSADRRLREWPRSRS